jgi:hypothetical protein
MGNNGSLRRSAAICALMAAALVVPTAAQQDEDAEPANVPAGPRSCLAQPTIARTKILNGRNIVFVTRHDTIYNNELPKECPSLRRGSLVSYGIANGRLCAGDGFQVLWETNPGTYMPSAFCRLGTFVPITAAELDDLLTMTEERGERRRRGRSSREAVTTEQVEPPPAPAAESTAEE